MPVLEKRLNDPDLTVREHVELAIKKLKTWHGGDEDFDAIR